MSVVILPFSAAIKEIGRDISGTETITALMLAYQAISPDR